MTLADTFKRQIDQLIEQDLESQKRTQETLQRIRSLISDLESIDFEA